MKNKLQWSSYFSSLSHRHHMTRTRARDSPATVECVCVCLSSVDVLSCWGVRVCVVLLRVKREKSLCANFRTVLSSQAVCQLLTSVRLGSYICWTRRMPACLNHRLKAAEVILLSTLGYYTTSALYLVLAITDHYICYLQYR